MIEPDEESAPNWENAQIAVLHAHVQDLRALRDETIRNVPNSIDWTRSPMIDITAYDTPMTYVPREGNRFFISRRDCLLLLCKECGGVVSCVLHVPERAAQVPAVHRCVCVKREDARTFRELVPDRRVRS